MSRSNNKKTEPWRIIVFILAVLYIIFMWAKKDLGAIYAGLPREELLPLLATTVGVTLLKVAAITGGILLIKWLTGKFLKK